MYAMIKYFLFIFLINLAMVRMNTGDGKLSQKEIEEEAENRRYKEALANYEERMKNQKPVELNPQFIEYKNYIIGEIMKRAEP